MYTLIENFCLGIRRLEIFGRATSLRRGWVTVLTRGNDRQLTVSEDGSVHVEGEEGWLATTWRQEAWDEQVKQLHTNGRAVVPMTPEIDALRPKSPVRHNQNMSSGGGSAMSGGVAVGIPGGSNNNTNSGGARFNSGNRPNSFISHGPALLPQNQMVHQNQMMAQQNMMGMGVSVNQFGLGMGVPVPIDEMMSSGWNHMMNAGPMGGMNVNGMGPPGMPGGPGHVGMNTSNVNLGMPSVVPMGGVNVGPHIPIHHQQQQMMNHMGMGGGGFQGHSAVGFGNGVPVFNPTMNNAGMGWGDQGQCIFKSIFC
jgi:mRNA (2'-O-methyladenosine-N6-)-methyltransferase